MSNHKKTLLGNQAIAQGAVEAKVELATAYPGTPSTEILEYLAEITTSDQMHVEWAVNEKVALETAVGSSYSGARVLCCMKHVGVNVAADPLVTLAYTGVRGGLVLAIADDPGMHSSQNEQDSRFYAKFVKVPMLEPANPRQAKEMIKDAYGLSEDLSLPVMLRSLTRVSHTSAPVPVTDEKGKRKKSRKWERDPHRLVMIPAYARERHKVLNEKQSLIQEKSESSKYNRIIPGDGDLGVIACGSAFEYAKEFHEEDFSILQIGMYPLPEQKIKDFIKDKRKIVVLEEGEPYTEDFVSCLHENVVGKRSGDLPMDGDLSPELVSSVLDKKVTHEQKTGSDLPPRPPVMCPGCPHRATYYSLLQNNPTLVTGDIGCYTLGVQKPLQALDSCLCMGASVGKAAGLSHSGLDKVAAVIGESTFLHSGVTSLMSAVYNKANILLMILDNSTVAMTGHQPTPATALDIRGRETKKASIEEICRACGADSVDVIDPYDVQTSEDLIGKRLNQKGVNVIIARAPCVMLKSTESQAPYEVTECQACGQCLDLGCPSINQNQDETVSINHLCAGCGVCAIVCPFDAIKQKE